MTHVPHRTPQRSPLRPHQQEAVDAVTARFAAGEARTQLILPCGTGKTRIGAHLAHGHRRVVVFVPSLALVEQTLREWQQTDLDMDPVIVCSDPSTAAGTLEREGDGDLPRIRWHDRAVPVTTNPDRLARLLSRGARHGTQVVLSTYHSAPVLAQGITYAAASVRFDLLVADEAHRLAGDPSAAFQLALDDAAVPADRRLFMTATPVLSTDPGVRGRVRMDDSRLFGEVAHKMTFAQAIDAGLLCDYEVLVVAERADDAAPPATDDEDHLGVAAAAALRAAVTTRNLQRVLTFHGRIRSAERFVGFLNQAGPLPDGRATWARVVASDTPIAQRRRTLRELLDGGTGVRVVSSARCLSEGVDLPAVDGVVFCSPKHSVVDIVQSVGRVLRPAPGKLTGTIVLPVLLPRDHTDDDSALLSSAFGHVWSVLRALRAHDERLGQQVDTLARDHAWRVHRSGPRDVDRVTWLLPPGLADAAELRLVDEVASGWEKMFGLLCRYADDHGHTRVPFGCTAGPEDVPLGAWVDTQRRTYRRGLIPADRAARLAALPGWAWSAEDARWQENLAALTAADRDGLDLAALSAMRAAGRVHRTLGEFAAAQRVAYRSGTLTSDRARDLGSLPGWRWHVLDPDDTVMVDTLADYVAWEGDPNVPGDYVEGELRLGAWLNGLRRRKLLGTAAPELLDEVAAVCPGRHTALALRWQAQETRWLLGLDAVRAFSAREGHLQVPEDHVEVVDGHRVELTQWCRARRHEHRTGHLTPERAVLLGQVPGWWWEAQAAPRVAADIGAGDHGTRGGYVRGCRCEPCTGAHRAYNRHHSTRARQGEQTTDWVDAGPVAAHLQDLVAQGASRRAIVRESGLNRNAVTDLLSGKTTRVTPATRDRALAVTLASARSNVAARTLVDPAPTWVLLDDLIGRGWPKSWIARELGSTASAAPALQVKRTAVTAENAAKVAELAARIGDRVPPPQRRGVPLPALAELEVADPGQLPGTADPRETAAA